MGNPDELVYNYGKIGSSMEAITTFETSMKARIEDLEGRIEKELLPKWTGESSAAYDEQRIVWRGAMDKIGEILKQVSASLGAGADDIQFTDKKWSSAFRG